MYPANDRFAYARGYFGVFPKGFSRTAGEGSTYETDEYIICFKKDTPEDIKQRVIKDYAEYHKEYMDKFLGRTAQQ